MQELQKYGNQSEPLYIEQAFAVASINDNYSGHVKDFTSWMVAKKLTIEPESIKLYFTELNNSDKYTAGTKRVKRQAVKSRIRTFFESAGIEQTVYINTFLGKLDKNPATKAPKINNHAVTRDMFLEPFEIERIINISRSQRQKLFIRALYNTACRVSELCDIKLSDCKINDLTVKIRIVKGKGDKERFVMMNTTLFEELKEEFQGKKYLIETSGGKQYRPEYISNQIKKQGKRINKTISAHTMRHSFAMEYNKRNPGKLKSLADYLGHSSTSITANMYLHDTATPDEIMEMAI